MRLTAYPLDAPPCDLSALAKHLEARTWAVNAACRGRTELFFSTEPSVVAEAKRLCWTCPVVAECRDAAIAAGEQGTWGAATERERGLPGPPAPPPQPEKRTRVTVTVDGAEYEAFVRWQAERKSA